MGTRLRVTALEVRDHPDAVVRGFPIAEVVILARTEPIEVEGPDDLHIEWSGDLGLSPDLGPNPEFSGRLKTTFAPGAHAVTATGAAGGSSVTVRVWQSETEVVNGPAFDITAIVGGQLLRSVGAFNRLRSPSMPMDQTKAGLQSRLRRMD